MINQITSTEVRWMSESEGLILQGCGGNLEEWLNGINELFTQEKLLLDSSMFKNIYSFNHNGKACLVFPFDEVKLDIGKLAIWRLQTHERFGGTWLSDFVSNQLGGFVTKQPEKEHITQNPDCPLVGADGNIFNLLGIARNTLREHGMQDQAKEMSDRVTSSSSYNEALSVITEYVNPVSVEDIGEAYDEDVGLRL